MSKRIIKGLIIIGLLWVFMINLAWGTEYGYIHYKAIPISPSHLKPNKPITRLVIIGCYDAWSGRYINCEFTHAVIGLKEPYIGTCEECIKNNGGHCHNYDTHPLIDPPVCESCDSPGGQLEYSGTIIERGDLWIKGQTGDYMAIIGHRMPQVAGKIVTETTVNLLGTWYCVSGCYTRTSFKDEDTLDVGVDGFERLKDPGPDEHYFKLRGGTVTHPEGHWGTEDTIEKLKKIGVAYYNITKKTRVLSINDISLPRGGLFDYKNTWKPPHKSHRTGTDADINQGQGPSNKDQIPCYKNDKLKKAVRKVAGEQLYPILRCENKDKEYCIAPEGEDCIYYHIDFD